MGQQDTCGPGSAAFEVPLAPSEVSQGHGQAQGKAQTVSQVTQSQGQENRGLLKRGLQEPTSGRGQPVCIGGSLGHGQ